MNSPHSQDSDSNQSRDGSSNESFEYFSQLRMVIEHAPVILWAVDRDGVFTISEGRGLVGPGLKPGEVVGKSLFDLYRDVPKITSSVADALDGRKLWSTVNVGQRWFDTVYAPLRDENEEIKGVIGVSTDVTQRHQAEKARYAADERFRHVFHSSPVGMLIIRCSDAYPMDANERFLGMCNRSLEELREGGLVQLEATLSPSETHRWRALIAAGLPISGEEARYITPAGDELIALISVIEIDTDETPCLLITAEDITEQKRAEQATLELNEVLERRIADRTAELTHVNDRLRQEASERHRTLQALEESENAWRDLVANAPDLIIKVNRQGRVTFINHPVPPLTHKDVLGRSILDFVPAAHSQLVAQNLEHVLSTAETVSFESEGLGPGHSWARYSCRVGPIRRNGAVVEAMVIARDITRERITEQELHQRRNELAHVSRLTSMGELTSTITHEIAQPLHSISATAGACVHWLESDTPDLNLLRDATNVLRKESHRASETIRRLWNFLKKHEVQFRSVDANRMIREVVALTASEAANHGIEVQQELESGLPHISGDEIQLQQVLLNLVLNGMEAMHDVEPERRKLILRSRTTESDAILISVRDFGTGLPNASLDRIFEAFFSTKRNGLGMGLAISRSIIEAHSGQLQASQHDDGATLTILLPRHRSRTSTANEESSHGN